MNTNVLPYLFNYYSKPLNYLVGLDYSGVACRVTEPTAVEMSAFSQIKWRLVCGAESSKTAHLFM